MRNITDFYKNNFNLIRLLAALMVLVTHSYELSGVLKDEPLYNLTEGKLRLSTAGLYLFFFTSGFLVTKSLLTTPETTRFIWKRFLRIYPALVIVVLITVFIIGPVFTTLSNTGYFTDVTTYQYLFTATGIYIRHILPGVFEGPQHFDHGVNGSLWSIALELKLYFLMIIAGVLIKQKIKYVIPVITVLATCSYLMILYNLFNLQQHFTLLNSSLFMIFWIGSICCYYYEKIKLNIVILLIITLLWILCFFYFDPARMIFELLFFSYLTLWCSYTNKTIRMKFDLSYGIYIYAFPVTQIFVAFYPGINPGNLILLLLAVVLPLSWLSWTLVEKKALKLKKTPLHG